MAALYGRLQGSRGQATRCGTEASGMTATLETWEGIIRVALDADGEFTVTLSDKNGNRRRQVIGGNVNDQSTKLSLSEFEGPFNEIMAKPQNVR